MAIDENREQELFKYIWGVINNCNCKLYRINSMPDHIHIFSDLHPSISLSDYVKKIKVSSSKWIKENNIFPIFEGWQDGYGAFTYAEKDKNNVIEYIKNQKEHHKKISYTDELKKLLQEFAIPYDEKYFD